MRKLKLVLKLVVLFFVLVLLTILNIILKPWYAMTKVVRRKKKAAPKKEIVHAQEQDCSEVYYEMRTVSEMAKIMTDSDLYDECMPYFGKYEADDLHEYYPRLVRGEELNAEERKKLEGFFILLNTELSVNA